MDEKQKELAKVIERYFGADAPYLDIDVFTLAKRIMEAGWITVQEWISVKDRLPEDVYGKDRDKIVVLVRTKSGNVSQCSRCADYDCHTDATLSQVKWTKNGQFYWSKGKRVTHWMPLPTPPKGE